MVSGAALSDLPSGQPRALRRARVDANAAYPRGIAVLDVTGERDEKFALRGYCCSPAHDLEYTSTEQQRRPAKDDLVALATGNASESARDTFLWLRNWSSTKGALRDWIRMIRAIHGDDLSLIIRDTTDFAIPWELFWVDGKDGDGDWLGSSVTLTRWTAILRDGPGAGYLPPPAASAGGNVIAYIRAEELEDHAATMSDLSAVVLSSLQDLMNELEKPGSPLALIYAACRGEFVNRSREFKLDSVSVADVDTAHFSRLATTGGLVFVNARHSARLYFDAELNDATLRGFAELFLRSGATGFIGTTGTVEESQTSRFLRALVARLRAEPDVPVAVAVRDLRRTCTVRRPPVAGDGAGTQRLLLFFYVFMYAYFGSPDGIVRLPPTPGAES